MNNKDFEEQLTNLKERVTKKEKNINTSVKLFKDI